jgi:hypothetical protein
MHARQARTLLLELLCQYKDPVAKCFMQGKNDDCHVAYENRNFPLPKISFGEKDLENHMISTLMKTLLIIRLRRFSWENPNNTSSKFYASFCSQLPSVNFPM